MPYPPWHQIHIIMKPIWGYGIGDSTIVEEELDDKLGSKTRPNSEVSIITHWFSMGFFILKKYYKIFCDILKHPYLCVSSKQN